MRWRTWCSLCPGPVSPGRWCLRTGRVPTQITSARALSVRPRLLLGCWRPCVETGRQSSSTWSYAVVKAPWVLCTHPHDCFLPVSRLQLWTCSCNQRRCVFSCGGFQLCRSEAAVGLVWTPAVSGAALHKHTHTHTSQSSFYQFRHWITPHGDVTHHIQH